MTGGSTISSTMHLLREYAYVGLRDRPGSLPLAELVGWAGLLLDPVFLPASLILIVLLFPTGSCRRTRWRPVATVVLAAFSDVGLLVVFCQAAGSGVQVALFGETGCSPCRRLVRVTRRSAVTGHLQQVCADRVETVVPGDPVVGLELFEQVKARVGP